MSRRKQEKPQPRKNLVKGECDLVQDTLTCGVCQKDFPLAEIVRFIQHKVHSCNKENCLLLGDSDTEDLVLGSRRPPISAPLVVRKEAPSRRDLTPPNSEDNGDKDDPVDYVSLKTLAAKDCGSPCQDLKANGISEPISYVCSTCKQSHPSAWDLLQHVQNTHGLKIYVDSSPTNSPQVMSTTPEQKENSVTTAKATPPERTSPPPPPTQTSAQNLRVPLLERQLDPTPIFPRPSSQELRLDIFGLSAGNHLPSITTTTPPPLLEGPQTLSDVPHSSSLSFEPQMDFYSQRLRELAGATSPNSALSPRKLLQPSFKAMLNKPGLCPTTPLHLQSPQQPTSKPSPQQSQPSSAASPTSSKGSSDHQPTSPKLNSCEYCGKSFRFPSNLVVHRRSHTGEKPYKCHICQHACSQASKLKRHMKTHRKKKKIPSAGNGSYLPGRTSGNSEQCESAESTPEYQERRKDRQTNGDRFDEQMSDELMENEEEMEDEEEDMEDEEEEGVYDEDEDDDADGEEENEDHDVRCKRSNHVSDTNDMVAEDLTTKCVKNGTQSSTGDDKKEEKRDRREKKTVRHSLLSEVMEKIGLAHIQQYNEAYKQALKESSICGSSVIKQERHSSGAEGSASNDASRMDDNPERPPREGTRSAGQSPLSFAPNLVSSAFESSMAIKRLRTDVSEQWRDKERESNLYAGLWIPTVSSSSAYRDLYMGISGDNSLDRCKTSTESALVSLSPGSGCGRGRSSSPRPGPSSGTGLNSISNSLLKPKEQKRNDTCEYCGKVFKNCSNLTVHRRSHTGEKPYKCELCSYACAQSSKLTRHMKTHGRLGKDVYRCRFCDMPFSVPSTLEKHMRKCVVSQSGSFLLSERDSDSKEMAT